MRRLYSQNVFLIITSLIIGVLLTACELVEKKPDIESVQKEPEKKVITPELTSPDISKLTLEEIHNLPDYKACMKLLARAELKLKIKPPVQVKVKAIKGMPDEFDTDNIFYLEPVAEKYPLDDSIRTYKCPRNLEDIKVTYKLIKGPGYKKWYGFSYHGKLKGIDVSPSSGPVGRVESRFGDKPPVITFQIDSIRIDTLKPLYTFSNEDLSFRINDIIFKSQNYISFQFFNKSKEALAIRKFEVELGPKVFEVDFKNDIIELAQYQMHKMSDVGVGLNRKKWYITNGDKPVRFTAKLLYKTGREIKKLSVEKYIRVKELGVNAK